MNFRNFRLLSKNLNFQIFKTVLDISVNFCPKLSRILKHSVLHLIIYKCFRSRILDIWYFNRECVLRIPSVSVVKGDSVSVFGRIRTKCLWRWEPDRRFNFFIDPPPHYDLCAVTNITEIRCGSRGGRAGVCWNPPPHLRPVPQACRLTISQIFRHCVEIEEIWM